MDRPIHVFNNLLALLFRVMYWSDWGSVAMIEKASMDGASRTVLHNTSLTWPNALTLDIPTQTLYWADASLDKIERSSVDGSNRQLLLSQPGSLHPFGIAVFGGQVYFSDWIRSSLLYANDTMGGSVLSLTGRITRPAGIQVVDQLKQPSCKH